MDAEVGSAVGGDDGSDVPAGEGETEGAGVGVAPLVGRTVGAGVGFTRPLQKSDLGMQYSQLEQHSPAPHTVG